MIVADTDVLIDFLKGHLPVADRIAEELRKGLATTAISAFELWAGATGSDKRMHAVESLLGAMRILPLQPEDARTAAFIRADGQKNGLTMGMADSLIAGICVQNRAVLLTRNLKHFQHIPHLYLGKI